MILYKYCNQEGAMKILASLELKIPRIASLNDPHDCYPYIVCSDDPGKIKAYMVRNFPLDNVKQPTGVELANYTQSTMSQIRFDSCLICVSETAREPVMWAHYAEGHKGMVIGFEFENLFGHPKIMGPKLNPVIYADDRPIMDVVDDSPKEIDANFKNVVLTKSSSWKYEKEYRVLIHETQLMHYAKLGFARREGSSQWYIKINPVSIKEVIFGIHSEECLKNSIKTIIKQEHFSNLSVWQAEQSKSFLFDLKKIQLEPVLKRVVKN